MPSPKPGRSPASGPHIKINTSSTRFPQRFRRSRCRGVPRGQDPVFIRAPRSPAGPGRRGKAGFGQAGADRSGFKRPGSSPQYIAGRTASAWPAPRLHRGGAGPGAPATVGRHLPCVSEFICGDIQPVSGARFATAVTGRLLPLGAVIGHDHAEGSVTDEPVENGDFTAFPVEFERGLGPWGGLARGVRAAEWPGVPGPLRERGGEVRPALPGRDSVVPARRRRGGQGRRAVVLGPDRPSPRGGLAMDAPGFRVRSERHLRSPGPRLRRGGRRAAGGRIAAVLRSVRRGCATWGLSLRSPGRQGRRSRKPGRLRTRLPARFRRGSAPRQSGVALPLGVIHI